VEAGSEDEARALVDDLCHRFLTNPVIEDSQVVITAGSAAVGA
jgi:phosphoribosylformylglycinamidine (FGAM) synthase PurS component